MTRKGKGKDTEKEKGVRFERCCGHCGEGRPRHEDCWSRQVSRVETDVAEPQDMNPTSEQTGASGGTHTHLISGLAR